MLLALLAAATLLVAFANGANDNFKGVATLHGSGTASYRTALLWGTATTLLGSLAALWTGTALLRRFAGRGLVPESLTSDPSFLAAVGLGGALAVLAASRLGFPVSTTHALMGALVGAGLVRATVFPAVLVTTFVLPLAISPVAAAALTAALYPALRSARQRLGIERDSCVCAGAEAPLAPAAAGAVAASGVARLVIATGTSHACRASYQGSVLGFTAQGTLDAAHWLTSGVLSFARGLNDAPKIAALALALRTLGPGSGIAAVAVAMAAGGILGARRVGRTMAERITAMNTGQGFTSSLVASALVLAASRYGLPVSTTHVTCGALFGLGAATGTARWRVVCQVLAAWVTTLPLAAALAALAAAVLAAP